LVSEELLRCGLVPLHIVYELDRNRSTYRLKTDRELIRFRWISATQIEIRFEDVDGHKDVLILNMEIM
jgi:hypothetical protein